MFLHRGSPEARHISHLFLHHRQPSASRAAPPAPQPQPPHAASVLPMLFSRRVLRCHVPLKITNVLNILRRPRALESKHPSQHPISRSHHLRAAPTDPAFVPELLIVYPFSGHLSDPGLSRNLASSSRLRTDLHPNFEVACAPVLKRPFCGARRHHSLHTAPARVHLLLIAFPAVLTTLFSRASVSSPPAPQPPSEQRRPWRGHQGR